MAPRHAIIVLLPFLVSGTGWCGAPEQTTAPVLHFLYGPTCVHCHPIKALLARTQETHSDFVWESHPLTEPANIGLMTQHYIEYGVPDDKWSETPAVFFGDRWWVEGDEVLAELDAAVQGSEAVGSNGAPETPVAGSAGGLLRRFGSFSAATVGGAGPIDSINPCALATIIFLLSYLGLRRRSRGRILAVGFVFSAGVLLAYLAVGMGAIRAISAIDPLSFAPKLVYSIPALLTLILAVVTIVDDRTAATGNSRDIKLKLPRSLSLASHSLIRRLRDARALVAVALVAGVLISILELFCADQVYLATLMYMWSASLLRAKVFAYLLLSVAMFTLPIVLLTVAVYSGTSTDAIARLAREKLAPVKLAAVGLFVLLGVHLTAVSLQVFSIYSDQQTSATTSAVGRVLEHPRALLSSCQGQAARSGREGHPLVPRCPRARAQRSATGLNAAASHSAGGHYHNRLQGACASI